MVCVIGSLLSRLFLLIRHHVFSCESINIKKKKHVHIVLYIHGFGIKRYMGDTSY